MIASSPEKPVETSRPGIPAAAPRPFKPFLIAAGALLLVFAKVLFDLFSYSLKTEMYSHIILIPFITGYLVHQDWKLLPLARPRFSAPAALLLFLGVGTLAAYFIASKAGAPPSLNDYLSFTVFAFFLLFCGLAIWMLGAAFAKAVAFPLCFLIFLTPFPEAMTVQLELWSQHASAEVYSWMMILTRATHYREGMFFTLPGITIQVAQECSGIRSSVVLFITSLIAGHMFLKSPWKKALFALLVIPLGLVRNAIRIYAISMLSAHVDPQIIHGPLHHKGGPIFFALSLIPFFAILIYLRKTEKKSAPVKN